MQLSKRILVEKTALFAIISTNEINHPQAKMFYKRILDWEWEIWLTSHTLVEVTDWMFLNYGPDSLKILLENISQFMHILWIEETVLTEAWKRISTPQGQMFNLADWISIIACEKLNAPVFSFRKEFSNEGIRVFPR
jgi:predicted nucleic acid-binding protein